MLSETPTLLLTLVQARFASGSHELYQLPLALLSPAGRATATAIAATPEWVAVDPVADPELAAELLRQIDAERTLDGEAGTFRFQRVELGGRSRWRRRSGRWAWSSPTRRSCSGTRRC